MDALEEDDALMEALNDNRGDADPVRDAREGDVVVVGDNVFEFAPLRVDVGDDAQFAVHANNINKIRAIAGDLFNEHDSEYYCNTRR